MLPPTLEQALASHLDGPLRRHVEVGGGCIANASRIETASSRYFLKWAPHPVGETFVAEAQGLSLLRSVDSSLVIPRVLAAEVPGTDVPGFLLLDWIEPGIPGDTFWEELGRGLASLHRNLSESYGADADNFIGRLPQLNTRAGKWPEFFRDYRLEPQVKRARERQLWVASWDSSLTSLYGRLSDLLPERPEASILHGDLWSGNIMVTSTGRAALIDPAAYHGHREADLAMTELFGGFQTGFYDAYKEAWPLEPDYPTRREIYNLYHLLNHLNHFGHSYSGAVASTLKRFA